jgi:ABC-type nitrate/sulfonate/bicarbonate transport system substrate-binding protein
LVVGSLAALIVAASASASSARPAATPNPKLISFTISAFAGPGQTAAIAQAAARFGRKYGFNIGIKYSVDLAAFYSNFATGQAQGITMESLVAHEQYNQGVPLQIISSLAGYSTAIVTRDPSINSITDLKGKTLAAALSGGQYQSLEMYAKTKKMDLRRDVQIVNAFGGAVQALITANRVDAAQATEPTITGLLKSIPGLRIIWSGQQAWREMTGDTARNLCLVVRKSWIQENPQAAVKLAALFRKAVSYVRDNPKAIDTLLVQKIKIPAGIFEEANRTGRFNWAVGEAWDPQVRTELLNMFRSAVVAGFIEKLPKQDILYQPPKASGG